MSGTIRMTPEQMRSRAAEYRTEADGLGDTIARMDSLLAQLQGEWEGTAAESYATRYEELKPGFLNAQQLIYDIDASLTSAAAALEQADASIAGSFAG